MGASDAEVLALERIAALGWSATESVRLGGWLLRASRGFTGRANSVLPLGGPGQPVDDAVAHCARWYADRGLPLKFQVPLLSDDALDTRLGEHGLAVVDVVRVLVCDVADLVADRGGPEVRVRPEPTAQWLAGYHYRGGDLPPHAVEVIGRGADLGFAMVPGDGGQPLAVARGSVDEGWLGITAVEVAPSARRQGLGAAVTRGLARWAAARGAGSAYLQVAVENTAGAGLYAALGFAEHHRYQYRVAVQP